MVRAFLIGAGATKAQYTNSPLNLDFFALLKSKNPELYSYLASSIGSHLARARNNPDLKLMQVDVEEVMNLSELFPPSIKRAFLISLNQAIYELLAKTTESEEGHILAAMNASVIKPSTLFHILLTEPKLNKDDFFMTLNYDLYLDREILALQGKIDYGLDKDRLIIRDVPLDFSESPSFSIYHLHGSLNWVFINGKIEPRLGAVKPKSSMLGSNLVLIPPGKKKIDSILEPIWGIAEKRLLKADELIIIGCSLNPSDIELMTLLRKFIDKKGINNVKIIDNFDPLDPFYKKNHDMIIGKGFKMHPYGFDINGPKHNSDIPGAIEFIFEK